MPAASSDPPASLLACHECDLLQHDVPLAPGETARCARCGAELARNPPDSLDRTLAYTLTAVILYVLANVFPLIGLELQGRYAEVTQFAAVRNLWQIGMQPVAALVFVTAQLFPLLEMSMILLVLVPLRFGYRLPRVTAFFRLVLSVQPWGMMEVFLLGMLVSLVKLAHSGSVILGTAFWATAALILVLTLAGRAFDRRLLWRMAVERA